MVSFKVIQVLEMSSFCKYLADGYHKHMRTHCTCIIHVTIVNTPRLNQSLLRRWYHSK